MSDFTLSQDFLDKYRHSPSPFSAIGEITYLRTYSRLMKNGKKEKWVDTVERVVTSAFQFQKEHILRQRMMWNEKEMNKSAERMFDKIFMMKFTPPGRGLFAMSLDLVRKKGATPLNNCAFVSTKNLDEDPLTPFMFMMDVSLLGTGCGFSTEGAGKLIIKKPRDEIVLHKVEDSKEGWTESVRLLLESYFIEDKPNVIFQYDAIRKKGEPLLTFGGTSAGADPLIKAHKLMRQILERNIGNPISVTVITDIMNIIGKCLVSGGIRRVAQIAFGTADDEFINLKNYSKNPERMQWGWASNNSIFASVGDDFKKLEEHICQNGEPGIMFLDNCQNYSRMDGNPDYIDYRVDGGNPCLEQTLENFEMCNLVEVMINRNSTLDEFLETLTCAFLYAKIVTLIPTNWPQSNAIMFRNRRIGCSVTGIAQFLAKYNIHTLKYWLQEGYSTLQSFDTLISERFGIPRSIKITSVKPSGTVSLLSDSTPGIHYPISRFYIRRIRFTSDDKLLHSIRRKGYNVIDNPPMEDNTSIVEFPIDCGEGVRSQKDVSIWEQLSLIAFMQTNWADNAVSCTVTFDRKREGKEISKALAYFQYQLKCVSFLPRDDDNPTPYNYMPYEEITEEKFHEMSLKIKHDVLITTDQDAVVEIGCDGDHCTR